MQLIAYKSVLNDIKLRVQQAQNRAIISVNTEMVTLYWDIGRIIFKKQQTEGWGATITKKLAVDIKNELPEIKGFSERNLKFMVQFFKSYATEIAIGKQPVSQLPWGHIIFLMQNIKDENVRSWYVRQIIENGWSRNTLMSFIKSNLYERQRIKSSNFETHLPEIQSDLAKETLKDPYIFDFLTLAEPFAERELETELVKHIEKFLLELGTGFAFVGRQYHLNVGEQDFYIDLLFYHLKMRCFVVIDLKKGDFKPEYVGKMNFYCSVVDDVLKHQNDQPTIGLILCEKSNKIIAEYTLRDSLKPIGVSEFELSNALPDNLKLSLPSIEEIENELSNL